MQKYVRNRAINSISFYYNLCYNYFAKGKLL